MFSFQQTFALPTEIVSRELFYRLFDDPQFSARWKVLKHREVKEEGCSERWLETPEYQEWARQMASDGTKAGKAFRGAESDRQRVVQWCDWLKRTLPSVMFMAWFDETLSAKGNRGRWRKKIGTNLSGLVILDIDHIDDPRGFVNGRWKIENGKLVAREEWAAANNCQLSILNSQLQQILLLMVSPGGHGLKVVFKANKEWGNLADNIIEKSLQLGLQPDFSGIDSTRACFVSLREDILFINEEELFTYEDKEFAEEWREVYRAGGTVYPAYHDKDDGHWTGPAAVPHAEPADAGGPGNGAAVPAVEGAGVAAGVQNRVKSTQREPSHLCSFGGWTGTVEELMAEVYRETGEPGSQPEGQPRMSRHGESLKRAYDLLVMTGRNKKLVEQMLRSLPWVDAIVKERGEDVAETVSSADARLKEAERKYATPKPSKAVQEAVKRLKGDNGGEAEKTDEEEAKLPLEAWGREIEELFDYYPCLREACDGQTAGCYPAVLFTTAAFLGTLMTRCTWHHWYDPDVERRLNYCVIIIGPPTSGKSFATRLYKLLAAPIKSADKVGYDAINRFKEEKSSKADNKEKPKKPVVIIRDHPARTANGVFITDMVNAVETIDGKPMNLHMLTFDSELDNATLMSKGGQWIDKTAMELKAFHNEEDGQAYANLDSVSGKFNVYWNFVYTGTPVSLDRKVNERNFGTGLATRLAVIPMPDRKFQIAEYNQPRRRNQAADEVLKTWAFHLDQVKGELPLEPLLRTTYDWLVEHEEVAAYDDDRAADMLLMRVPYYGIAIAAPFILMRHWEEWKEKQTLSIDETDQRLCRLAMDIQYRCQTYYFGKYAEMFFDNLRTTVANRRQRPSKYDRKYLDLPNEFDVKDVELTYGISYKAAKTVCCRLFKKQTIERTVIGKYRKVKASLTS